MNDRPAFEEWALVELFGHQRLAGKVSEQQIGGASFLRVDVPAVNDQPGFTRLFGAAAIYSITPMSQEIALRLAVNVDSRPVQRYELQLPALNAPVEEELPFDA